MAARQIPLDLPHPESRARADFLAAPSNRAALALIDAWPEWPAPIVALTGPEGSGKSHLASIFAARSGAAILPAGALEAAAVPRALAAGALVLEDIGDDALDEAALFHLMNLAGEQRANVLMTARRAPAALAAGLATADLASRLRAVPAVEIGAPDDALLAAVAYKLFADRQITPEEGLVPFMLARMERSLAALRDLVAALDREALARKRPLNKSLASELLRAQSGSGSGETDEDG
jgi:chromosomal replication initiation ATPase DnaA